MNFKHYLQRHFDTCPCIAETQDLHRDRKVKVFALPGHFDHVGVSDGTDSWIAPINAINPFWINVRRLMEQLRAGTDLKDLVMVRSRLRLELQQPPQQVKRQRIAFVESPPPAEKKRVRVLLST